MEFRKHYTRDEARALLPLVKQWLKQLAVLRRRLDHCDERLARMKTAQVDLGGREVNAWVRIMADMKSVLQEFFRREIQVKDLERGLVDFPALIGGREVFLCWEKGEADIKYWHDLEAGYAGRERFEDE